MPGRADHFRYCELLPAFSSANLEGAGGVSETTAMLLSPRTIEANRSRFAVGERGETISIALDSGGMIGARISVPLDSGVSANLIFAAEGLGSVDGFGGDPSGEIAGDAFVSFLIRWVGSIGSPCMSWFCLAYGKQGITAVILRADEVRQALIMIRSSIKLSMLVYMYH